MIVLPFDGPMIILIDLNNLARQCTEVCFASFLSGGFITTIVVNPPERKLAERTSVQLVADLVLGHIKLLIES